MSKKSGSPRIAKTFKPKIAEGYASAQRGELFGPDEVRAKLAELKRTRSNHGLMRKYELTAEAIGDLFEIWNFIARDNAEAAEPG